MKFLFIFAHPDDETVACGSTIKQLVDQGEQVELVVVTDGSGGEIVTAAARHKLQELGSIIELRRHELHLVQQHLGIAQVHNLDYQDGTITNATVWGQLTSDMIAVLDKVKPDFVITFDHTGWYFHLDHVGTSIATTLAYQQAIHRPQGLLLSNYYIPGSKWNYIYPALQTTHVVDIKDPDHKLQAIALHNSQDLTRPQEFLKTKAGKTEKYQLSLTTEAAEQHLAQCQIFRKV